MAAYRSLIGDLREAAPAVMDAILQLNQGNVTELSELDGVRLASLAATAFRASVIGEGAAFLLAFDQDARYDSPNFQWFRCQYPCFVYVDRVAVAPSARGNGFASYLYLDLFDVARAAGHEVVTCEVNIDPPNLPSDALHAALGFEEVGRAKLPSGKLVRYLAKMIAG